MNTKSKDGGIFSFYLDNNNNMHYGDEAFTNCLNTLGSISMRQPYKPKSLPTLSPLSYNDIVTIQPLMSWNKALSFDGISDKFLRGTKNIDLL